jgi:hypothetical protein
MQSAKEVVETMCGRVAETVWGNSDPIGVGGTVHAMDGVARVQVRCLMQLEQG